MILSIWFSIFLITVELWDDVFVELLLYHQALTWVVMFWWDPVRFVFQRSPSHLNPPSHHIYPQWISSVILFLTQSCSLLPVLHNWSLSLLFQNRFISIVNFVILTVKAFSRSLVNMLSNSSLQCPFCYFPQLWKLLIYS